MYRVTVTTSGAPTSIWPVTDLLREWDDNPSLTDFGLIGNLTLTVIPMISGSGRSSHAQRSTNTATTIGTVPTVPHWFVQPI